MMRTPWEADPRHDVRRGEGVVRPVPFAVTRLDGNENTMATRLYFDNAATSFPKPGCVMEATQRYWQDIGASAGRGAYLEAVETGRLIRQCRGDVARLINAERPESIVFGMNCSDGLNLAIKGLLKAGDHAITTWMDHNSVLRPLNSLKEQVGLEVTFVECDGRTGRVDPGDVVRAIRPETRLIAVVHGSNVTGSLQPIREIGAAAREKGVLFLVDAAQTCGHYPIDVRLDGIDLLAAPGHKGCLGPLGTGFLYIRPGVEKAVRPLKEGGTGSISEQVVHPDFMPDRYEAGSHNAVGLVGLGAGVRWVLDRGVEALREHERRLCEVFLSAAGGIGGLTVYGPHEVNDRVGVFSVRVEGYTPAELAAALETHFGVLTRPGLHCAPLAHQTIGTHEQGGTTRFSFGPFIEERDVEHVVSSLMELAGAGRPPAHQAGDSRKAALR
jgi:cysteine desulfurase / selenocysteine lyase